MYYLRAPDIMSTRSTPVSDEEYLQAIDELETLESVAIDEMCSQFWSLVRRGTAGMSIEDMTTVYGTMISLLENGEVVAKLTANGHWNHAMACVAAVGSEVARLKTLRSRLTSSAPKKDSSEDAVAAAYDLHFNAAYAKARFPNSSCHVKIALFTLR